MIAHIAEAGEARGRVVLRICRQPEPLALRAAVRLAKAYRAEIESLFVEDEDLLAFARFSFARELSPAGRASRPVDVRAIEREFRMLRARASTMLAELAAREEVGVVTRTLRDDPQRATVIACAASGPWNVIVLADPVGHDGFQQIKQLLETVADATGIVMVGRAPRTIDGPVIVALDRVEDLMGSIRAGNTIAAASGAECAVMLVGDNDDAVADLEGEVRLALATAYGYDHASPAIVRTGAFGGHPAAMVYALRSLCPGFVIARLGGPIADDSVSLLALRNDLECPVLLARSG